jgi:hypothetical protein
VTTTKYNITDHRVSKARNAFSALPVADADAAAELSARPVESFDGSLDVYEPQPKERSYDLGTALRHHFGEFLRYHAVKKESTDWTKQFKLLLPPVVGKSTLLTMGERPVATFRNTGPLNMALLNNEQPDVITKYTRRKWVEVFDKEAFAAELPHLYEAYRGRRFVLVSNGAAAGLVLPQ